MPTHPMISARALGTVPRFIELEAGSRGLMQAHAIAGLPLGIERNDRQFITQQSLLKLIDFAARVVGDDRLGLVLAPHLTPTDYGTWGQYILSAPTLGDGLERTIRSLHWHSSPADLSLSHSGEFVRCAYHVGAAGTPLYENFAYCAAGVMVNLIRAYLGHGWRPARIELDIPRARSVGRAGDSFGCEVQFGSDAIAILIPAQDLAGAPRRRTDVPTVTLADVRRSHAASAPRNLPEVVVEMVRLQLLASAVSAERTARYLQTGVRTLQRQLDRHGLTFRDIVNVARTERAKELLAEHDLSITEVATELGYSAPSHFARAFARQTGLSPRQFRRSGAIAVA